MSASDTFWSKEPSVAVNLTTSLLSLGASFGFALNHQQTVSIVGAVFAVASLVSGFAVRAKVSAPSTVIKIQADAQAAIDAANADKTNILAAIGTAKDATKVNVPKTPDPPVAETDVDPAVVLASMPTTTAQAPANVIP